MPRQPHAVLLVDGDAGVRLEQVVFRHLDLGPKLTVGGDLSEVDVVVPVAIGVPRDPQGAGGVRGRLWDPGAGAAHPRRRGPAVALQLRPEHVGRRVLVPHPHQVQVSAPVAHQPVEHVRVVAVGDRPARPPGAVRERPPVQMPLLPLPLGPDRPNASLAVDGDFGPQHVGLLASQLPGLRPPGGRLAPSVDVVALGGVTLPRHPDVAVIGFRDRR